MRELHVYSQDCPHEEVFIVGNREALEALAAQIQKVLAEKEPQQSTHFAGDGEGFRLLVAEVSEPMIDWADPYTHEIFEEKRKDAKSPWNHEGMVKLLKGPHPAEDEVKP